MRSLQSGTDLKRLLKEEFREGESDVRMPIPPPTSSLSLVAPTSSPYRLLLSQPASFARPHRHAKVLISLCPLGVWPKPPPPRKRELGLSPSPSPNEY